MWIIPFLYLSFESWFDIAGISQNAEDLVAKEREQNILHMLHQVKTIHFFGEEHCIPKPFSFHCNIKPPNQCNI